MSPKRSKRTKQSGVPEKETQEHAVRKKKPVQSFNKYLYAVLKDVYSEVAISSRAMNIMNSFMFDIFERIVTEAARLVKYSKKSTMSSNDIESAVKLLLPGELAKHAISEGTKAVRKYNQSKSKSD